MSSDRHSGCPAYAELYPAELYPAHPNLLLDERQTADANLCRSHAHNSPRHKFFLSDFQYLVEQGRNVNALQPLDPNANDRRPICDMNGQQSVKIGIEGNDDSACPTSFVKKLLV